MEHNRKDFGLGAEIDNFCHGMWQDGVNKFSWGYRDGKRFHNELLGYRDALKGASDSEGIKIYDELQKVCDSKFPLLFYRPMINEVHKIKREFGIDGAYHNNV